MTCFTLLVIAAAALTLLGALATKDRRQKSHALYATATLVAVLAVLDILRGHWGLFGLSVATMIGLCLWADSEHGAGKGRQ